MTSDTDEASIPEPSIIEELLRIFQAASKRGEDVALTLVSRGSKVMANFKLNDSMETGIPAAKINKSNKKPSPCQLRRNQSRMASFIQKKELENKQKTTESVEIVQCDSPTNKTSASNWKVQKPSGTNTEDRMIVKLTKQPVTSMKPQVDELFQIYSTYNTKHTSHINTHDFFYFLFNKYRSHSLDIMDTAQSFIANGFILH